MAKKVLKKILVIAMVAALALSIMIVGASAKKDDSTTHIFNSDNSEKLPFDKNTIEVYYNNDKYTFYDNGSGSWTNDQNFPELNLGADESAAIVIVAGGVTYDAFLVNHSAPSGNNGHASTGTDTYDISGVAPQVTPDPVNPDPNNPNPDNPNPDNPNPDNPNPDNPDPVDPDPVNPDPVNPDPVVPVNPPVIPYIPPVDPVVINDDPVPLAELPDEDVPLAELPEEDADDGLEDIFDEDVPLADVPQTGTAIAAFSAVAAVSGIGLAWFGLKKKD